MPTRKEEATGKGNERDQPWLITAAMWLPDCTGRCIPRKGDTFGTPSNASLGTSLSDEPACVIDQILVSTLSQRSQTLMKFSDSTRAQMLVDSEQRM